MKTSSQKNTSDAPLEDSEKGKNLRKESDKMMEEAKKQEQAMPRHGEPIGGA